MNTRLWMICYDIADDRRRRRIDAILRGHGERVQESVFECYLNDTDRHRLRQSLVAEIDAAEDNLRWYPLCRWCAPKIVRQGLGRASDDPGLWIV